MKLQKIRRMEFVEFFRTGFGLPVGIEPSAETNASWCKDKKDCPRSKYQAMMKKKMHRK